MLRTVLSIVFLSVALATAPTAMSAEPDSEKCAKRANCEKGQCDVSACTGEACSKSTCASDGCANKACSGDACAKLASTAGTCANKPCGGEACAKLASTAGTCANKPCSGEACAKLASTCASDCCAKKSCTGEGCPDFATASNCGAGKSDAGSACEAKSRASCEPGLIHLTTTLESAADAPCDKTSCSKGVCSATCCDNQQKTACCADDDLVDGSGPFHGFAGFPAVFAVRAITTADCEDSSSANCCTDTAKKYQRQIVALHSRLIEECAKNKVLTAQLKYREELTKAHVEFAKKMLQKEIEVAHLHTELQLSDVRSKANQELAETAFEFERFKAEHAEALAASKAAGAGLAKRVADLEKQLESIYLRLANQPNGKQVK